MKLTSEQIIQAGKNQKWKINLHQKIYNMLQLNKKQYQFKNK